MKFILSSTAHYSIAAILCLLSVASNGMDYEPYPSKDSNRTKYLIITGPYKGKKAYLYYPHDRLHPKQLSLKNHIILEYFTSCLNSSEKPRVMIDEYLESRYYQYKERVIISAFIQKHWVLLHESWIADPTSLEQKHHNDNQKLSKNNGKQEVK